MAMTVKTVDFITKIVDCRPHEGRSLRMILTRPAGTGIFPVVLDLHGGGWGGKSMEECGDRDVVLAKAGIIGAALDFRHGDAGYPTSLKDINYAIRWLKANAQDLSIDSKRVGICGQSSGGHLAMLAAMRPNDPRYAEIHLAGNASEVDANVVCIGMAWPVINPLSRYRHARRARAATPSAAWVGDLPERHETYWKTEAVMAEGNPMLALERQETIATPPALWVQGAPDPAHDYRDPSSPIEMNEPERFAHNYRAAGGKIDVRYIDFESREGNTSHDPLAEFFCQHLA
jgi:acetyl esterase/lipase